MDEIDLFYDQINRLHQTYFGDLTFFQLWNKLTNYFQRHNFDVCSNNRFLLLLKIYIHDNTIDLSKEEWRDVVGYEGLYKISNMGRVKSCTHVTNENHPIKRKHTSIGKNISLEVTNLGYRMAHVSKNGIGCRLCVHRMVAEAFLPNPSKLPCINHKDEQPWNNTVDNLEWCSYAYNNAYNGLNKRRSKTRKKHFLDGTIKFGNKIYELDDDYNILCSYDNCEDARRKTGKSVHHALNRNKTLKCGKHYWMRADEYEYIQNIVPKNVFQKFMKFYLTLDHPRLLKQNENNQKIDLLIKEVL